MEAMPKIRVQVRHIIRADLPDLQSIEGKLAHPWTAKQWLRLCIHPRHRIGLLAVVGGWPVGFALYARKAERFHLMRLAVHPGWRRMGIGSQLLMKVIEGLNPPKRDTVTCRVREGDLPGQLFLANAGFLCRGILQGHFDEEAAYCFDFRVL